MNKSYAYRLNPEVTSAITKSETVHCRTVGVAAYVAITSENANRMDDSQVTEDYPYFISS